MFMAKKKQATHQHTEFTLRDVRHYSAQGIHVALTAIENAIKNGITILQEVWEWVATNFAKNSRVLNMLTEHAPNLVPQPKMAWTGNLHLPIRRKG